ncbi:PilZ domain-containing protein [Telmatobacter bradus]|uniref:PilZ domain-containing protein n=1 Tax=Telmatobacter bradus TaxID=474953 RepID=UPI003B42C85F
MLNNQISALSKMAKRPVLVNIDELGRQLNGQVTEMTATYARVRPSAFFYLCNSVYAEISFRYEDVIYMLSGTSEPTGRDNTFKIEFDSVARKTMGTLGKALGAAGLMDEEKKSLIYTPSPLGIEDVSNLLPKGDEKALLKRLARKIRRELPPGGIDRRACCRYEVESEVRLTFIRECKLQQCLMIDLSLTGCRLFFEDPCPVPLGTQVEIQFLENGYPLRLAASVQVVANPHTLGLKFSNNSLRMKERLACLIEELGS